MQVDAAATLLQAHVVADAPLVQHQLPQLLPGDGLHRRQQPVEPRRLVPAAQRACSPGQGRQASSWQYEANSVRSTSLAWLCRCISVLHKSPSPHLIRHRCCWPWRTAVGSAGGVALVGRHPPPLLPTRKAAPIVLLLQAHAPLLKRAAGQACKCSLVPPWCKAVRLAACALTALLSKLPAPTRSCRLGSAVW